MEDVRVILQIESPGCHAGGKCLLKAAVTFRESHEKENKEEGNPVIPQERIREGVNGPMRKPVNSASEQQ